jgi:tetratricopeptide (TPR) repeat protein
MVRRMYPRLLIVPASAVIALALACTTPAATHQAEDASRATQGRHDDAVAAATKNVELAPKDPNAYDTLGEILLGAGKLDQAEQAFRDALKVSREFFVAHDGLAVIQFHRGDEAAGLAELKAGIEASATIQDPGGRTRLLEDLAWAHIMAGREAEALAALEESVKAQQLGEPGTVKAVTHVGRARLLSYSGKWDRAIAEARAAREPTAPRYVGLAALAVETMARAGAGDVASAKILLAELESQVGTDHPLALEAAFHVALAGRDLKKATSVLARIQDPYVGDDARLALALALEGTPGQEPTAFSMLEQLSKSYRRSARSAHMRRTAEKALRERKPPGATGK